MFFSDDLLSSKKGSFGIIWLAATLGPKTKRITRKQLTTVDLNRTCELIAEPPEPLALRLSGCLLVGVARVYNQNYDLFYTDVTKFHSDLRRMVLTEFGTATGAAGQPAGLDLTGDGKAKIDQITFGGEDASWLSGLNADFLNMHWKNPVYANRKRAASSQLSTLPSQQSRHDSIIDEGEEEETQSSDDEESVSITDPEDERHNKRRKTRDEPFLIDDLDLGLFVDTPFHNDVPGAPMDSSLVELPNETGDAAQEVNFDDPGHDHRVTPLRSPGREIDGINGDQDEQQKGSQGPQDSNEGAAQPEKKKKKVKRSRKVTFDDDLEIEYDLLRDATYAENMSLERGETQLKERVKTIEDRATALVDGGGDWVAFMDIEMKELFAACSKVDIFQWEQDTSDGRGVLKYHEKAVEVQEQEVQFTEQDQGYDIFGPKDMTDPSAPYLDPYIDYSIPLPNEEPEVPRRQSQSQRSQIETQLPWTDQAFESDDFGDVDPGNFTPGSRLSIMTPLERKIRLSSGKSSLMRQGRNRNRSPSVLGDKSTRTPQQLVSDEEADDFDPFNPANLPENQFRGELPEAFQPHMLASLETQCRDFLTFTERKMIQEEKTEIDFERMVEIGSTKKVAALAFYNCLTLATKQILAVSQPLPWNAITFKFKLDV